MMAGTFIDLPSISVGVVAHLKKVMHQDHVENPGHHAIFGGRQLPKVGVALSLKKLRDVSFVNPLVGKDDDISNGASNPPKHNDPVWTDQHAYPVDIYLEGEASEVKVVDVGVEDAYDFLFHVPFDDDEFHPLIIWNSHAYREVAKARLLHISLNEDLLL